LDHEAKQCLFAIWANDSHPCYIDDEFTLIRITSPVLRETRQLVGPGRDELTFQEKNTLGLAVFNGNLQHTLRNATIVPNDESYKSCRFIGSEQSVAPRVENVIDKLNSQHSQRPGKPLADQARPCGIIGPKFLKQKEPRTILAAHTAVEMLRQLRLST
jgi:hypothetical protein